MAYDTGESEEKDFSTPVLLDDDLVQQEKKKFLELAKETQKKSSEKDSTKARGESNPQTSQKEKKSLKRKNTGPNKSKPNKKCSKKRKLNLFSEKCVPIISSPTDLLGKLVDHLTQRSLSDQNKMEWHKGLVHGIKGGSKKSPKFLIQYYSKDLEGVDTSVCHLYDDFKNDELRLIQVTPQDFESADKIKCLYEDEDGLEAWWEGQVDGIDEKSNSENPVFYVYYKNNETDTYECFDEPLVENYLKGQVKFLDIPDM